MRKICVITSSRADYGLLKSLIRKIKFDKSLQLQLLVTGSHLSEEFGSTFKEIKKDGFLINDKIEIILSSDTPAAVCASIGLGNILFSKSYTKLKPDLLIILGDRYELLSAAISALIHNIPIAHIHGGEKTIGAFDDSIRNAITKISNLHFVSTNEYRKRVIQMGEDKKSVFNFGGFGAEAIKSITLFKKKEIENILKFSFLKKNIVVTFHPETHNIKSSKKNINEILKAIKSFSDIMFIFTLSNADPEGRVINKLVINFVSKNKNSIFSYSLGQKMYYSILKNVDGVLGNSSSGILEVPSFKIGTINIGDRQYGRIQAKNTINVVASKNKIVNAINKITSKNFKKKIKNLNSPYYKPHTSSNVLNVIKRLKTINTKKDFKDIVF